MSSWKVVLFSAVVLCLALQGPAYGVCPLGLNVPIFDPCFGRVCQRFPLAECETVDCEARFILGDTDVTDHCNIDYCEVHGIQCNGLCKIHPISGPYCQPSCDINDGGCGEEEVCVQRRLFCIRSPCPQPIECVPKSVFCDLPPSTESCGLKPTTQFFYNTTSQSCEQFLYGGCDHEGTENRFTSQAECQTTCSGVTDPCSTVRCPSGTRCQIDVNSGAPFCDPSCEYENGGCAEDKICRLEPVFCVTTPCLPAVQCLPREETCSLRPEVGNCQQKIYYYFYNNDTRRCDKFVYSGCGGNGNQFLLLEECWEECERPLNPVEDPCFLIDCAPGSTCQVNELTGEGECVFEDPCVSIECPFDAVCQVNNETGQAECVTTPVPCALILCHISQICRVDPLTQSGYCGENPCNLLDCGPQSVCHYVPEIDEGVCVPSPCHGVLCQNDTFCHVNGSGIAECVSEEELCSQLRCPPDSHCEIEGNGQPACVKDPHPCDDVRCWFFQICRVDPLTQTGYCGFNPCFFTFCAFGFHCQYNEETDSAVCLPPEDDPCISTRCPQGAECTVNEETGDPECIFDPCSYLLCQPGLQCQVNESGNAECVLPLP